MSRFAPLMFVVGMLLTPATAQVQHGLDKTKLATINVLDVAGGKKGTFYFLECPEVLTYDYHQN